MADLVQSPWGMIDPDKVKQVGLMALKSGAVSPQDAMSNYSSLVGGGSSPMTSSPMPSNPGGGQPPPLSMAMGETSKPANVIPNAVAKNAFSRKTVADDKTLTNKTTTINRLQAPEMQAFEESYNKLPEVQAQNAGNDRLENMMNMQKDMLQNSSNVNLAPLLALADSQTGSKLSEGYTPPASPLQTSTAFANMAEKVQDKKQQSTKDLLSAFQNLKSGQSTQSLIDLQKTMLMNGYGNPNAHAGAGNQDLFKWSQQYNGDKQLNTATTSLQSASTLQNLLDQNTSAADFMAKVAALRASGLNRVTNFEMAAFQGDKSALNQANQALSTLKEGNLDPSNIENMKKAVAVLGDTAQKAYDNRRAYFKNLGDKAGLDTATLLNPEGNKVTPPAGAKIKVKSADGKDIRMIDASDLPHALADKYTQVQ